MHEFIKAEQFQPVGTWDVLAWCGTQAEDNQCPENGERKWAFINKWKHAQQKTLLSGTQKGFSFIKWSLSPDQFFIILNAQ